MTKLQIKPNYFQLKLFSSMKNFLTIGWFVFDKIHIFVITYKQRYRAF